MKTYSSNYNSCKTEKGNIIWCGAMNIAWTDFKDMNTKKDIKLKTQDAQAQRQINNFNQSAFTSDDIDQKSFYVKTGYGKKTQAQINREVRIQFPNYSFNNLEYNLKPFDIISFAYIFKKLDFQCKFQRRSNGFMFNGVQTKSFYALGQAQKRQVTVIEYTNRDRFCVRLCDRLLNDAIYLIKNKKITTVDKAIQVSIEAQKKGGKQINKKDLFQMPIIDISCVHHYEKLTDLPFLNQQLKGYFLKVMCEALKIKIDENGTLLQNRAMLVCTKGPVKNSVLPRQFILDSTFWLVIKQNNKNPYLCMQICNPIDIQN